jgi:hypothetical protein
MESLNFLLIVFDFGRSTEGDFTETIMTLAGLSCFIIADITNPKSSPLELQAAVPNYMIPFVPIINAHEVIHIATSAYTRQRITNQHIQNPHSSNICT